MPSKQASKPQEAAPKAAPVDPSAWTVNTERTAPKRHVIKEGADRTPFYRLLDALKEGQVVEIPTPLDSKEAKRVENLVRESAKDKGLSVTFLADSERNAAVPDLPEDKSHYVWFVKGKYEPRGPRTKK